MLIAQLLPLAGWGTESSIILAEKMVDDVDKLVFHISLNII